MEPSETDSQDQAPARAPAWPPPPRAAEQDLPDIQIYPSPKRGVRMLLLASVLVCMAAFDLLFGWISHQSFMITIGIVGIVFFGGGSAAFFALSLRRQPLVEITRRGLIDRSSLIAVGLIPWGEIQAARIGGPMAAKYLIVYVSEPDDIIRRQKPYQQWLMRRNVKLIGSPVAIAGSLLSMPLDELQGHILQRMGTPASTEQSL